MLIYWWSITEINTALKITNPAIGDGQWNLVVEVAASRTEHGSDHFYGFD